MGWTWLKQNWNKRPLNVFLCASVFGSMFVKIHCWLFECPLVGLRVKEPRHVQTTFGVHALLDSEDAGSVSYAKQVTCWCLPWGTEAACQHCEEPRAAGLETGCYKCCSLWHLVALWWLIIPTQFTVSISFPMLREPCFAWFLAPPDDLLIAPVRYWPNQERLDVLTAEKNQASQMPPGSSGMQQQSNPWLKGILGSQVGPVCCSGVTCFWWNYVVFVFSTSPFWNKTIRIIRRGCRWPRHVSRANSGSLRITSQLLHVWQSWSRNFRWLGQCLPRCADTARDFETQLC